MDGEKVEGNTETKRSIRPGLDVYVPEVSKFGSFMASGTEYFIETPHQQSIDRKVEFVNEVIRMVTGTDEGGLMRALVEIRNANNKLDASTVGYHVNTLIYKMAETQERRDPVLFAAAMFINTRDEDRVSIPSDADRIRKIDDWAKEGIAYHFFTGLLATFNATLAPLFANTIPTSQVRQPSPQ